MKLPSKNKIAAFGGCAAMVGLYFYKKPFSAPCDGRRLKRPFGHWVHKAYGTDCFHTGIDFHLPVGCPIYAAASGRVTIAGTMTHGKEGFGQCIEIDHGNGWFSFYAHLKEIGVSVGQKVKRGDLIALSGRSGHCKNIPQLHFEIRKNGLAQDPLPLLRW